MIRLIILLITLIPLSLNGQTVTKKEVTIDPYLSFQNYEHFKRLTLSSPDSSIEYVDGFEFDWGYKYALSVQEIALKYTLSDGTKYDYSLDEIISKTKMPDAAQFELYLDPERYYYKVDSSEQAQNSTLKKRTDSTFLYFDKVEILVPEHFRKEFDAILKGKTAIGTFLFIDEKRIKLIKL